MKDPAPSSAVLLGYRLEGKIHESLNSVVYRGTKCSDDQPAILKALKADHPDPSEAARYRHEFEMLCGIDVDGVVQALALEEHEGRPVIILEDIGAESLRRATANERPPIGEFLPLAIRISESLGRLHAANVLHLNISPDNIVVNRETGQVNIIDLGSAVPMDRGGHQKIQPDQMSGTLSCISPEQTGRINRAVDERSDLYSLGVVLYELLTGQLPFDSEDPMELIHHHIARVPAAPTEVSPEIPEAVGAIIMKLLEKNAEQRYQTAGGLAADLQRCLVLLLGGGRIEAFPLGEEDVSSWLRIPDRLYGRQAEIEQVLAAYERAAAGGRELLLVAGAPGVGKSALVREVQPAVTAGGGLFAEGKFDQYQRVVPFTALTQAFTSLCRIILGEPEAAFESWRARLQGALGEIGQVAVDLVPALEKIVGPQPEVPPLEGHAAQNRLRYLLARLVSTMAGLEHPLLLFIDDIQWIDSATLGLLEALLLDPEIDGLLVVGALRDSEVDETHIFAIAQRGLESRGLGLETLSLGDLDLPAITELVSDTVGAGAEDLAEVVHGKTAGNPFFAHRLLSLMADEGHLRFDPDDRRWRWDPGAIRGLPASDNVVDLLTLQVSKLPEETRGLLELGSCVGDRFDIDLLTGLNELSFEDVAGILGRSVAGGFVTEHLGTCRFVHDRIQQAVHSRMDPEQRARAHLWIGRALEGESRDKNLLAIAEHLAQATSLLDENELLELVEIDLQAARAAGRAAAFAAGLTYARAGLDILGESGWERKYRLTLALHEQAALMAHAAGDIPGMEHHKEQVLQFGRGSLDLARVQRLHIEFLSSSRCFDEAIDYGLEALRLLGQEFPPEPDMEFTVAKLSGLLERLEREPPDYLSMPRLHDQDPELHAVSELLFPVGNAAFISRPVLAPLMFMRSLELSIERQLLPEHTPGVIAAVGMFAHALLGKVEVAHAYGETAVELAGRAAFHTFSHVPLQVHGLYSHFWREPLRETLDLFDRGIQSAHDCGDNEFVAYMSHSWSKHAFYASIELAGVEERCLELRPFVDGIQYVTQSRWINIYVTAVQALRGRSSARGITWRGTPFDDGRDLPDLQRVEDQLGLLYAYCAKAWVATLFGDHDGVAEFSDLSYSFLVAAPVGLEKALLTFISGLRRARELRVIPESSESEQALQEQLDLLERFAGLAPMNFAHKLSLVLAEVHRARGKVLPAMQAYEEASQGALENGYLSEAGLAHALAAEFFQDLDLPQAALHHAEQAARAWRSWGADALVDNLSERWPDLSLLQSTRQDTADSSGITHSVIDLETVTKASRILASDIVLSKLLANMMHIVIQNAGATHGYLILEKEQQWVVEAAGDVDKAEIETYEPTPVKSTAGVSAGIVQYVGRTANTVLLNDAANEGEFTTDPTISSTRAQSVLCHPLVNRGQVSGILYLENKLAAGAFTSERVELLQLLSSQMAMTLDNARLYSNLEDEVAAQTRALRKARDDAEAASRAKSDFLANISHEIRTPMNAILGFAEILGDQETDPKKSGYLRGIHSSGKALLRLISDILDLSKIEAGKLELQHSALSVASLIRELQLVFEEKIAGKGLRFIVEAAEDLTTALILDEIRLRQVLTNLLDNAVKFTRTGHIRLGITLTWNDPGARSSAKLVFEVEDTGIGIAPEMHRQIFSPFEQAAGQKSGDYGGTGLGLTISRRLVELMGGEIGLESKSGKGATFRVTLPEVEVAAVESWQEEETGPNLDSIRFTPATLLIADDIDYNRELLTIFLQKQPFEILEATGGAEAIDMARANLPDVILLDMKMPGMDGYQAAERLKADDELKSIPLIAVTAAVLKEDVERIHRLCDGYLRKPLSRKDLIEGLMNVLPFRPPEAGEESPPAFPGATPVEVTPEALRVLPAEWLESFSRAVRGADADACRSLLGELPATTGRLSRSLELMVRNYRFGELIGIIERTIGQDDGKRQS